MAENTDDRLRLLIERVERLEEEKKGIQDDIKDVYGEAKAVGYDAKIMRQIVRLRKMKRNGHDPRHLQGCARPRLSCSCEIRDRAISGRNRNSRNAVLDMTPVRPDRISW